MYAPPIQPYTSFMQTFASLNANRTGAPAFTFAPAMTYSNSSLPTSVTGIVPVPDSDFIFQYALNNTNTTRWAVVFNNQTSTTSNPTLNIQYQLWFNTTLSANGSDPYGREILSMMRGLDEAIISNLNDPTATVTANIDVSLKDWPLIPPSTLSDNVVSTLGAVFFFCSEMVIFINVLNQIVVEKEMKLRIALEMSGLGVRKKNRLSEREIWRELDRQSNLLHLHFCRALHIGSAPT